jgi:hypothetical protein
MSRCVHLDWIVVKRDWTDEDEEISKDRDTESVNVTKISA